MISNTHNFPIKELKDQFPIFLKKIYGKPLTFLDTAASAQKPYCVIDEVKKCYSENYSNIHRGIYYLSSNLTKQYEDTRIKVSKFMNCEDPSEIVFTKSATEALNLLATSLCKSYINNDDEIILSYLEHHANIVPWQIQKSNNVKLVISKLNDNFSLNINDLLSKITPKTKLISITHMSNSLGHITDIKKIISVANKKNIPVIVDGCQYIAHGKVDVQELGCDFYVFSGHKIYGPSGVGVLYGKKDWLKKLPPYQGGGDMIERVSFEKTTFASAPQKFEAGTPPIAQVIGLGAAIDFVQNIGIEEIKSYEKFLYQHAYEKMTELPNVKIIGHSENKGAIISFTMSNAHPSDIATIFDQEGVAIRSGHHCTQPLMNEIGISQTARISFGLYNTIDDIDILVESIKKVNNFFK